MRTILTVYFIIGTYFPITPSEGNLIAV